jgi:hypothetical protein
VVTVRRERASLADQATEVAGVERGLVDSEAVSGRAGCDRVRADDASQLRDVGLQHLGRGRRRPLAPELVDQPLDRDGLVRMEQQDAEQRALLRRVKCDRAGVVRDVQRPENPELHTSVLPPSDPPS